MNESLSSLQKAMVKEFKDEFFKKDVCPVVRRKPDNRKKLKL